MKTLSTALIIALCGSLAQAAELTKDTLAAVRQNVASGKAVLVDVREKHEWDAGRVKGSIFAPLSGLKNPDAAQQLQTTLPKDKVLYTFCVVGKRAVAAGNLLEKLGYEVRPLRPGYNELLKAGFEKAAD